MISYPTPLSELGLRAFPPEIREMIFTLSAMLAWTGKTPALLIALRCDRELYAEALAYFHARNVFRLHAGNNWKTGDMAFPALQTIRALSITFWSSEDSDWEEDSSAAQVLLPSTHTFAHHAVLRAAAVRDVLLDVSGLTAYTMKACLVPAVACAAHLPQLRRIAVALPRIVPHRADEAYDASGVIEDLVGEFNAQLGVSGKLTAVGARCAVAERQVWFWEGAFVVRREVVSDVRREGK